LINPLLLLLFCNDFHRARCHHVFTSVVDFIYQHLKTSQLNLLFCCNEPSAMLVETVTCRGLVLLNRSGSWLERSIIISVRRSTSTVLVIARWSYGSSALWWWWIVQLCREMG